MEVIMHSHNASVSEPMRARAEQSVRKVAARLHRTVDAIIRFEEDGPVRRVELVLHAPRHKQLIAKGKSSRYFGPALTQALTRLETQMERLKRTEITRSRRLAEE